MTICEEKTKLVTFNIKTMLFLGQSMANISRVFLNNFLVKARGVLIQTFEWPLGTDQVVLS